MAVEPSDLILVAFFAGIGSEVGKEFWAWIKTRLIRSVVSNSKKVMENGTTTNH